MESLKRSGRRRGIALIEMALLLPLLLLILLGLLEYGWLFLKLQAANGATREAVRIAVRPSATNAQVTTRVSDMMTNAGIPATAYSVVLTPADVAVVLPGVQIEVKVLVEYDEIGLFNAPLIPTPDDLTAKTTMAKEGPIPPGS